MTEITNVLVANRGEIAVRIIRAAHDAGKSATAVYADSDADSPHVALADQAFALGGSTSAETYLNIPALIDAAHKAGADAVHPGYGFLAENADFARAVTDAGLIWIGPGADAITALGDKVTARAIAREVGAPLTPGTEQPVAGGEEIIDFARQHGLPIAIKAAYGGGGRGMKVVRTLEDIPEAFESATREAVAAFGRGECFIERYLDRARHVEVQVVADGFGHVVTVGDRDCSVQRRHQKLVEEAPAPFITEDQRRAIHRSAADICRAAGYVGAGTVEFLVAPDGLVSFLEVNTRLQVEHPVTEETTGIDLVLEQFRIAEGKPLSLNEAPAPRGHAIEFRINGEDAATGFIPQPGTITRWRPPSGPGVRLESGVNEGGVVGGQFDSMLAKLIVWGPTRKAAIHRARRALGEFSVDGIATVIPFHRALLEDPAFLEDGMYTTWIESEWDNQLQPYDDSGDSSPDAEVAARRIAVEVDGRRVEVALPASLGMSAPTRRKKRRRAATSQAANGDAVASPMQATVTKVEVADGAEVVEGQTLLVLEAMKMESPVKAHKSGTVAGLSVAAGAGVTRGEVLLEIH